METIEKIQYKTPMIGVDPILYPFKNRTNQIEPI
jgi:hypothetical protein